MAAQESEVFNIEDCPNYNNFLDIDESMDSIWNYVTEIRPGGRMMFKPEVFTSEGQYDHFLSFLNLDPNVTFEFVTEHPNRHYPEKSFLRYQQYIDGIPIEGGGVVVSGIFAPGQGPGGPAGPCARLGMMVPHIANDINIDLNPTYDQDHAFDLYDTLPPLSPDSLTLIDADLVITSNMNLDCSYHLAWKFIYLNEYNAERFAYVDAHTGDVLNSGNTALGSMEAPTHHYGNVTIENYNESGTTWLKSPDKRIRVYHHYRPQACQLLKSYDKDSIPSTTNLDWLMDDDTVAFQAFYVADKVLPFFEQIDIKFDTVHLKVGCLRPNAEFHSDLTDDGNYYAYFGTDEKNKSMATFNVVCHEFGHGYIYNFISAYSIYTRSLHEGIADMFGIYCNYLYTSQLNWVYGHESYIPSTTTMPRDLENPIEDCFEDLSYYQDDTGHERGMPLGHLFYLLVEGGSTYGAPTFPIEKALDLILVGLPEIRRHNSDYPDLKDATLNQAIENYGLCSDEFNALVLAWEKICVDTDFSIHFKESGNQKVKDCEYYTFGSLETCWNSDNAQICLNLPDSINHGVNPNHITWTITGPGSAEFESARGMQGNQQQGGTCLKIISIPELEYYPRRVNIKVDFTTEEDGPMTLNHRLLMQDCTGTKPDCETYHGQRVIAENDENGQDDQSDYSEMVEENNSTMEVYDMLGRLLYQGRIMDINTIDVPRHQVLIIRYLGKNGQVNKTHKTIKVR